MAEHIWTFIGARRTGFRLAGMPMSPLMWTAMAAIIAGVVVSAFAMFRREGVAAGAGAQQPTNRTGVLCVLFLGLLVDQMKPATLAFIEPGMRQEYHIGRATVALLPMIALTGTVVGSLVWGRVADHIGRRATIVAGALLFVATTVCGAMPTFAGNLIMCAMMGVAAGGMMPVIYALLSETLPAARKGVIMVLIAGLSSACGYLAASGFALLLIPLAGWRVVWFAQLPLALALIAFNRWIPESDGFAAAGSGVTALPATAMLRRSSLSNTLAVSGYALSWGVVYWGYVTFLPTLLSGPSRHNVSAETVLAASSLLSIPACGAAAWLYGCWARGALAVYAALTTTALIVLALMGLTVSRLALVAVLAGLLAGASGMIALLGPYTAETYPERLRGTASGWVAAVGKSGGAFGPPLIAWLLDGAGVRMTELMVALPLAVCAVVIVLAGSPVTRLGVAQPAVE